MTRKDISDIFKRFFIVFLCCLPILLVLGWYLRKIHNIAMIAINCGVVAVVFVIEELIYSSFKKKRLARREAEKSKKNKNI